MALISLWFFYCCDKQGRSDCWNAEVVGSPRQPKLGRGVGDLGAGHAGAHADFSLFFEHAS
jgi:hypothetical protein